MKRRKLGWVTVVVGLVVLAAGVIQAVETTIPASYLSTAGKYYTDIIGGGIGTVMLPREDDSPSVSFNLGFNLTFFGNAYTSAYLNNNGNISFNSAISQYTPSGPVGAAQPMISPFFADVDTRNTASGLVYLRNDIPNQVIVTWDQVGYYSSHADKLDSFQLVVRGPSYSVPAGEGQVGFFYKGMQWETGDASGGSGGFGGTPAAVGFGDGAGTGYTLQGSLQNGISSVVNNKYIWFNLTSGGVTPITGPSTPAVPTVSPWALVLLGLGIFGMGQYLTSRRASSGGRG